MSPTVATVALLLYIATVVIFALYGLVLKLDEGKTRPRPKWPRSWTGWVPRPDRLPYKTSQPGRARTH